MQSLNWDDLRLFLAVARSGQLKAAAKAMGLDHTTIARRMNSLEEAVATLLIERSPRGVRLTSAGRAVMEHAERIEAEMFSLGGAITTPDSIVSGAVRLATPEAFGAFLVSPNLSALYEAHPKIELELRAESRAVSLAQREADLAVTFNRPREGRLVAQKLTDYGLGLYASRDYLERAGPVRDLDDVRRRPMVWYIDELIDWPELRYLDQVVQDARTVFRSNSITAQQNAVAAGLGLGLLHKFAASQDARLVPVLPEAVAVKRSYWLSVHADQQKIPRVRAVIDFISSLIKSRRHVF